MFSGECRRHSRECLIYSGEYLTCSGEFSKYSGEFCVESIEPPPLFTRLSLLPKHSYESPKHSYEYKKHSNEFYRHSYECLERKRRCKQTQDQKTDTCLKTTTTRHSVGPADTQREHRYLHLTLTRQKHPRPRTVPGPARAGRYPNGLRPHEQTRTKYTTVLIINQISGPR